MLRSIAHINKRQKKRIISSLLALICGILVVYYQQAKPNNSFIADTAGNTYAVRQVFDGDTIEINMNGKLEKVRFIGVDTPETHDPRKPVQCFGKAASSFTTNELSNKRVRLESDTQSTNRDRYDRLLRYVYSEDGVLINKALISEGYGFAYVGFPFTKMEEFKAAQNTARSENKGLWAGCKPVASPSGGFTSNNKQ